MIYSWKRVFLLGISYFYGSCLSAAQLGIQQVKGILGESLTFPVEIPTLQPAMEINWRYGPEENKDWPIARIQNGKIDVFQKRFESRLQVDNVTNHLSINNLQAEDTGFYQVEVYKAMEFQKRFFLSVHDVVPIPRVTKGSGTGENGCVLLCSVENGNVVSVFWQRNGTTLTQPSSQNTTQLELSFHEMQGLNAIYRYTCVASNPASNQTITVTPSDYCPRKESRLSTDFIVRVLAFIVLSGVVIAVCVTVWKKLNASSECRIGETGLQPSQQTDPDLSPVDEQDQP